MTDTALELVKTDLPEPVLRRNINEAQWRTLCNNLYPGADPHSVLMVVDYCAARKLDPLKKPCHIVPMNVKNAKTGEWGWRDVVMPGIYEYRTTAHRTGKYLGHSEPMYGPETTILGVTAPAWCAMTFFRWNSDLGVKAEFPVKVIFQEVLGTTKDRKSGELKVNDRWSKAPIQMLTKCTEAAGLREAFPEEFGGEQTAEEMDGQRAFVDVEAVPSVRPAQRVSQQTQPTDPAPPATTPDPSQAVSTTHQPTSPQPDASAASVKTGESPAPAPASPKVGSIVKLTDRGGGIWTVALSTKFQAATKDPQIVRALQSIQAKNGRLELGTRPASDPTKLDVITEVLPIEG